MGCVGVTEGRFLCRRGSAARHSGQYDWRRQRLRHRRADGRPVLRRLGRAYRAAGGPGKLGFVAALLVGACVSAACVILLKAFAKRNPLTSPLTMN